MALLLLAASTHGERRALPNARRDLLLLLQEGLLLRHLSDSWREATRRGPSSLIRAPFRAPLETAYWIGDRVGGLRVDLYLFYVLREARR
jgi:hypothetical protein